MVSPPPQEYFNFLIASVAICLFVGMILGVLIGMSEEKKPCEVCAGIVAEHAKAVRSANRITTTARQTRRTMHEQIADELDDDCHPWFDGCVHTNER